MKISLFALSFLLFLLIATCVYQETYTLYAMQTTQEQKPTVVVKAEQASPISIVKEEKTSKAEVVLVKEIEKHTPVKDTTIVKKTLPAPHVVHKVQQKEKVITQIAKPSSPTVKEKSLVKKHTSTATQILTSGSKGKDHSVVIPKVISHTKEVPKKDIKLVETEAVGYLLKVLNEQDRALKERNVTVSKLHALIKKALEERKQAIESMQKVVHTSAKKQASQLDIRDQTSQNIIEQHKKGE